MRDEEFIKLHERDDVRQLALKAHSVEGIDLPYCLDQIAGRQMARRKLPSWAAVDFIVYPPHISMEQCSSEPTALYKKSVLDRLHSSFIIDLTGGFGVDFSFMSRGFSKAVYVERQQHLCDVARHNFGCLGLDNVEVVCDEAESYLASCSEADVIYLDPARRDTHGAKTYAISDCTPDVIALLPLLLKKSRIVMIKLSPMLDWRKAVTDLGEENIVEVHIVSVDNECKELLIILSSVKDSSSSLYCVNISNASISSTNLSLFGQSSSGKRQFARLDKPDVLDVPAFLYEPNASIMKAGCFDVLCERYPGLIKIAPNSHLFVSDTEISDFPGRIFSIKKTTTMNKKELRLALAGITSANIATRNFPMSVAELRKRLKIKDGGDTYIFATTDNNGAHIIYICAKLS
ncbi:MAG: SAM-dependent methyltransferase, partial [Prevotella sp.]